MDERRKAALALVALEAGWWVVQKDDCISVMKGSYSCPDESAHYDPDIDDDDAEMRFDLVKTLAAHAGALGLTPSPLVEGLTEADKAALTTALLFIKTKVDEMAEDDSDFTLSPTLGHALADLVGYIPTIDFLITRLQQKGECRTMAEATRARKEHKCCLCHESIAKGSEYIRRDMTPWNAHDNEVFWTYKAHPGCDHIYKAVGEEFDWQVPSDSDEWKGVVKSYDWKQKGG